MNKESDKSVELQGHKRLYPSLTDPSWLILRTRRELFRKWIERDDRRDLAVLDIGGRIQPYRPLLEGRIQSYIAIDIRETSLVDIVARGEQIPLKAGQCDLVICTQTLQYASDPALVIGEIYRILKPGGLLLLSVPATAIRDAHEEAWRFFPDFSRQIVVPVSRDRNSGRRRNRYWSLPDHQHGPRNHRSVPFLTCNLPLDALSHYQSAWIHDRQMCTERQ